MSLFTKISLIKWKHFYTEYGVEVRIDNEICLWSDGIIMVNIVLSSIKNDMVEIGNIVNTLGTCMMVDLDSNV